MPTRTDREEKTGLLLINLGTPDGADPTSVRRYLREFLNDPRVVDIPAIGRWLLLNLIILPFRPAKSAHAYQKVWMKEGSPLLVHSLALRDRMREEMGAGWQVELGMRYGNPSISHATNALLAAGVTRIVAAPLFPQYASSSTGSAVEELYRSIGRRWNVPSVSVLPPFYAEPGFLDAFATIGQRHVSAFRPDHVLFSFHGLPERQIQKSDDSGGHCLQTEDCCAHHSAVNRNCYRAQSFATAKALAQRLALPESGWSVSFQSRLGRSPWIRPHTDVVLPELAARGVRRVLVFCPAFVADCLETLEEISIRAKEQFLSVGGEDLLLVPSLNSDPAWVRALADLVRPMDPGRRLLPLLTGTTG
jgi:ferrochelatase